MTVETLFKEFVNLPASEQQHFLDHVLSYLCDPDSVQTPIEVIEENRRRIKDFEEGRTKAIPYKEALVNLRAELGL